MADTMKLAFEYFDKHWVPEVETLIKLDTGREADNEEDEKKCIDNLIILRNYVWGLADELKKDLKTIKIENFQWIRTETDGDPIITLEPADDTECANADFWVYGFALGPRDASNRICIATHADAVPAQDNDTWGSPPFTPQIKKDQDYPTGIFQTTDLMCGRGAVDNKGQLASSLAVARAICQTYDGDERMQDTRIEFISDSAEETRMGVPFYVKWCDDNRPGRPFDLGIVYDGAWMVVAEKGVERPIFSVESVNNKEDHPLYLDSLTTPAGTSVNTVPDYATAVVKGDDSAVKQFIQTVSDAYSNCGWENAVADEKGERYVPCTLKVESERDEQNGLYATLTALNRGPQHGSSAAANEANPIQCLSYFLGGLVSEKKLGLTPIGALAHFIRWEWSTNALGENRKELLYREDDLFGKGIRNGTSYALTNLVQDENGKINLKLDIRYITYHHIEDWQHGDSEGLLKGEDSLLGGYFQRESASFMSLNPGYPKVFLESTYTKYPPDVRDASTNRSCIILDQAFREGMRAIGKLDLAAAGVNNIPTGGSTDAKGNPCMVAVGLFGLDSGHPLNFHGIDEACPINDIRLSTAFVFRAMCIAIENPPSDLPTAGTLENNSLSSSRMLEYLAKDSDMGCNC